MTTDHGRDGDATVRADAPVDIDEEHTRLLTYRHAAAAASARISLLDELLGRLRPVLATPGVQAGGDLGSSSLVDAIAAAVTTEIVNQASFRAAVGTLVSPVQQSLLVFVS
jgi:hypothetical protein